MQANINDWIRIEAYYASSGRTNERIQYEGYGIVMEIVSRDWYIVDIGVRNVMVTPEDITHNYGRNRPRQADDV